MRLLLIRLRIFYTVDTGGGNVKNARGRVGRGEGRGISRKRPLSEILRGAIRFGVDSL